MVRLHSSLLALTFATGLVLASTDDYERRDDDSYELFERDIDTFEEPEARGLLDGFLKIGEELGKDVGKKAIGKVFKTEASRGVTTSNLGEQAGKKVISTGRGRIGTVAKTEARRGVTTSNLGEQVGKKIISTGRGRIGTVVKSEGRRGVTTSKIGEQVGKNVFRGRIGTVVKTGARRGETTGTRRIGKQLKPSKILKELKPSRKTVLKQAKHAAKKLNENNNNNQNNGNQNNGNQKRANKDLANARKDIADADRNLPHDHQYHIVGRGLEDDEELSQRDLDAEEFFGREYDFLYERDTFDDLD